MDTVRAFVSQRRQVSPCSNCNSTTGLKIKDCVKRRMDTVFYICCNQYGEHKKRCRLNRHQPCEEVTVELESPLARDVIRRITEDSGKSDSSEDSPAQAEQLEPGVTAPAVRDPPGSQKAEQKAGRSGTLEPSVTAPSVRDPPKPQDDAAQLQQGAGQTAKADAAAQPERAKSEPPKQANKEVEVKNRPPSPVQQADGSVQKQEGGLEKPKAMMMAAGSEDKIRRVAAEAARV